MTRKKIEEVSEHFWEYEVNETNKELIEAFLEQELLSDATLKQYRSALKIFAKWLYDTTYSKRNGTEKLITELKARDALAFQNWLIKSGLSNSGVKFKRSAVSSLCGFIEVYYSDLYPDFRNIYSKAVRNVEKTTKKEKVPLTSKEMEKLTKELEKQGEWQKLAYVWMTYATGCRREEARQLEKVIATHKLEVDKEGKKKKYYLTNIVRAKGRGKSGNPRKFKFEEKTMKYIQKWMEVRAQQTLEAQEKNPDFVDDNPYLFVSKGKDGYRQLAKNTFNLWCDKFSEILGGRPVHPHLFRSTRATIAVMEEKKDIKSVQRMLGHSSVETTEIYVVRDDSDDDDELYD